MRILSPLVAIVVTTATSFLMEPIFPLGDWRWAVVAAVGLLVWVVAWAFSYRKNWRFWESTEPDSTSGSPSPVSVSIGNMTAIERMTVNVFPSGVAKRILRGLGSQVGIQSRAQIIVKKADGRTAWQDNDGLWHLPNGSTSAVQPYLDRDDKATPPSDSDT